MGKGNVLCVGPTYNSNDLKDELKNALKTQPDRRVDCVDLHYHDVARTNPDFVDEYTEQIRTYLDDAARTGSPYDVLVFGMSDIPSHQGVAKNITDVVRELGDDAVKKTIWIAFDSAAVLSSDFVASNHYAFATFSNSGIANQIVVAALSGEADDLGGRGNVPVEVRGLINHVEPMHTCPECQQHRFDREVLEKIIFALFGAVVAVLILRRVLVEWIIPALAGVSGLIMFAAGSSATVNIDSIGLRDMIVINLPQGLQHFLVPLVLSFVAFGLFEVLLYSVRRLKRFLSAAD